MFSIMAILRASRKLGFFLPHKRNEPQYREHRKRHKWNRNVIKHENKPLCARNNIYSTFKKWTSAILNIRMVQRDNAPNNRKRQSIR